MIKITMKNIIREGNPILRNRSSEMTFPLSDDDKQLAHDLMEFLENSQNEEIAEKYHLRAGVGLAAPQLAISKRMTAVLIPGPEGEEPTLKQVLINPTILSQSVQVAALSEGEGCLSVDRDVPGYVPRADRITLRYFDIEGTQHKIRLKNYEAIVVQHEIDHLNGILFFDHINTDKPFAIPNDAIMLE